MSQQAVEVAKATTSTLSHQSPSSLIVCGAWLTACRSDATSRCREVEPSRTGCDADRSGSKRQRGRWQERSHSAASRCRVWSAGRCRAVASQASWRSADELLRLYSNAVGVGTRTQPDCQAACWAWCRNSAGQPGTALLLIASDIHSPVELVEMLMLNT